MLADQVHLAVAAMPGPEVASMKQAQTSPVHSINPLLLVSQQ